MAARKKAGSNKGKKRGQDVPAPVGRPSAFRADYVERAYELCLLGLTDAQLAQCFDVSADTINEWKTAHVEFGEALRKGKQEADAKVVASLYKRATGYELLGQKVTKEGAVVPFVELVPPDVVACIFWLKNRQPKLWRDKPVEVNVHEGDKIVLPESFMDLVRKYAKGEKKS